jgi:hypothetical protein
MLEYLTVLLQIPDNCLVNKKLTKAFFKRNFDLTTAEKNLLDDFDCVKSIDWLASVSSTNANVVKWEDDLSIYEEVQFISLQTGEKNFERNKIKTAELVQKYIPYPIVLFIYNQEKFCLNTCDKNIHHNDRNKRTIVNCYYTEDITLENPDTLQQDFLKSLAFNMLDKTNLKTFYNGFTQRIIALKTAEFSGVYQSSSTTRSVADLQTLEKIEQLKKDIAKLQSQAKKETQLNYQVELNVRVNGLKTQLEGLIQSLKRK